MDDNVSIGALSVNDVESNENVKKEALSLKQNKANQQLETYKKAQLAGENPEKQRNWDDYFGLQAHDHHYP